MKVRYFILKQKNPYSQIYIRFWNGRKYDFKTSTGLKVNFSDWNEKKQNVKLKTTATDKDFINGKLMDLRKFVIENFNTEYNTGQIIPKNWLKTKVDIFFYRVDMTKPETVYFLDWINMFIENAPKRLNKGKPISPNTIKKYITTYNKLKDFEVITKKRLTFEDITMQFYYNFVDYARNNLKLGTNSIFTLVKEIKVFCNNIDFDGLPIPNHYKKFEIISEKADDIYLTTSEINKIFNFDLSHNPRLNNVRDLLIIGLNTGLRVSDFMKLDLSHIKDDTIRIQAQKTGKYAEIPINDQIRYTLEKRGGNLPKSISEQKFNNYIKELGEMVGFTEMVKGAKAVKLADGKTRKIKGTYKKFELITSHICRRSFATNLFGHLPNAVIMSITGHSTERQFLTYIKKTDTENAEILRNFYKQSAKEKGLVTNLKAV